MAKQLDKFIKEYIISKCSGIILTNNEIKDIIKVIKSLKNRRMLLKGNTRKITSREEGFSNIVRPLLKTRLPLVKSVLKCFVTIWIISSNVSKKCRNSKKKKKKKNHGSGITLLIFSNEGMIYLMKIVKPRENWRLAVKKIS